MDLILLDHALRLKWEETVSSVGAVRAYMFRSVQHLYQIEFSTQLLSNAAMVAVEQGDREFRDYFREHEKEESGHVLWARSDLDLVSQFTSARYQPSEAIKKLIKRQQVLLDSGDYIGFLGYIDALEGRPGDPYYWSRFSEMSGIPIDAFKSPIFHSLLDREHADELKSLVSSLDESKRGRIHAESAFTISAFTLAFCELLEKH